MKDSEMGKVIYFLVVLVTAFNLGCILVHSFMHRNVRKGVEQLRNNCSTNAFSIEKLRFSMENINIGEVYLGEYKGWMKFTKDDISDEVDGYIKIKGEWYKKEKVFKYFEELIKDRKDQIENKYKEKTTWDISHSFVSIGDITDMGSGDDVNIESLDIESNLTT